MDMLDNPIVLGAIVGLGFLVVMAIAFTKFYQKPGPEEAIVKTGFGGLKVQTGSGMVVIPLLQDASRMDLSVKRIEIARENEDGLICKDNIRADIRVAFYVRVNNADADIKQVAEMINPKRASQIDQLVELFEAKFSEALKTVGKQFDFVQLYTDRDSFRDEIIRVIGTDLNGYRLDNCHIDYLEQTLLEKLNPHNILDADGIKKITQLTTQENVKRNHFAVEEAKIIKQQDVDRDEALYELERQRVDAEQKQQREIAEITARNQAAAAAVQEEERQRAESARIVAEETIQVAEQNKDRQIIVALRNKERTDQVEIERVEKDRMLEVTERERVVGLADIEKEKAIEIEKRNIQEVIRERVMVERGVVEEQENIKNTQEFMGADREKQVAVTLAEKTAQEALVKEVKAAEAQKQSAEFSAQTIVIEAEAQRASAEKEMQSTKMLAEAKSADEAASGLAEATVTVAKADALEKQGTAEATVISRKGEAEATVIDQTGGAEATVVQKKAVAVAKGDEAKAVATEKVGTAEANVMELKFNAEANGIKEKAGSMKLFHDAGKEHEEFKLQLNKDKDIEIAAIGAQQQIAEAQAEIVGEALKTARIDIVGGETTFFDKIVDSVKAGKSVDRYISNSEVLTDVKNTFFNGDNEYFSAQLRAFATQFGVSFEDVKDLSVAALVGRMITMADSDSDKSKLEDLLRVFRGTGLANEKIASLGLSDSQSIADKKAK
ncbi:MAG: flotillin family protein [Planctomycetaceae bacterium]|nr:flotillin family protein [Planctomycetaceae bacterium]